MQRIPVVIQSAQLTTAAAVYYTAPSGTTSTINNLSLNNTSSSPVTVTLYRVPSGGTAGDSNTIMPSFSLSAKQSYVPPQAIGLHLSQGMTLQAVASTGSAVTLAGGAYETSGS
jgi:hypothetical protein